ncbi:hypothetical protein, partial [Paenibacillus sp. GbtcB18]|uniref:hypothetical protein n=1 Tax=Paenibacillus sp. GbtcB18 TaxID=2824763 RepID=UPI001C30173A
VPKVREKKKKKRQKGTFKLLTSIHWLQWVISAGTHLQNPPFNYVVINTIVTYVAKFTEETKNKYL